MIKMYTIECPKCMILERELIDKGIEFTKVMDTKIFSELEIHSFPMLEVNGKLLDFINSIKYINNI